MNRPKTLALLALALVPGLAPVALATPTELPGERIVVPMPGLPQLIPPCWNSTDLIACGLVVILTDCKNDTLVTAHGVSIGNAIALNPGLVNRDWELRVVIQTESGYVTETTTAGGTSHAHFVTHVESPPYVEYVDAELRIFDLSTQDWRRVASSYVATC